MRFFNKVDEWTEFWKFFLYYLKRDTWKLLLGLRMIITGIKFEYLNEENMTWLLQVSVGFIY